MRTRKHARTGAAHVVWLIFSASLAFLVMAPYLISLSALKFPHSSSYSLPLICANSVSCSSSSFYLDHRMRPQAWRARWLHVSTAPARVSWGTRHYPFQRRCFKQPSSTRRTLSSTAAYAMLLFELRQWFTYIYIRMRLLLITSSRTAHILHARCVSAARSAELGEKNTINNLHEVKAEQFTVRPRK